MPSSAYATRNRCAVPTRAHMAPRARMCLLLRGKGSADRRLVFICRYVLPSGFDPLAVPRAASKRKREGSPSEDLLK